MKAKIFLRADASASKGYYLNLVTDDDEWSNKYYSGHDSYHEIAEVAFELPSKKKMVQIGCEFVEEMKEDLARHITECTAKIKEYEAKFLMLEAPEEDSEPPDIDGYSDWSREPEDMDDPERHPI